MPDEAAQQERRNRILAYAALITACWIASGTFLVAKDATSRFEPFALGWFRIVLSYVLMQIIFLVRRSKISVQKPARSDWGRFILMGIFGVTLNQMLFLHGIDLAPPIDGALLYAFTPIVVLLAARFLLGETLTKRKLGGILAALLGVFLVLRTRGLSFSSESFRGDVVMVLAVFAWAAYTLLGKTVISRYNALTVNVWAFATGALTMAPFAPFVLRGFDWSAPGLSGWLGLLYLSLMTSVVSFTLWTWSLRFLEASRVAVFANLQPAMTALLAWWFMAEVPSLEVVLGGLLVILGVTIAQLNRRI